MAWQIIYIYATVRLCHFGHYKIILGHMKSTLGSELSDSCYNLPNDAIGHFSNENNDIFDRMKRLYSSRFGTIENIIITGIKNTKLKESS